MGFLRKYHDPHTQLLKLPVAATFQFLKVKGEKAGIRFYDRQMEIKKIMNNRNSSILAHGIRPVSEKAAM